MIAKFIPGVNTMGPPLAGSMKMPVRQFLLFDAHRCRALRVGVFHAGLSGARFSESHRQRVSNGRARHRRDLVRGRGDLHHLPHMAVRKNRVYRVVPRVQVQELIEKAGVGGS